LGEAKGFEDTCQAVGVHFLGCSVRSPLNLAGFLMLQEINLPQIDCRAELIDKDRDD